MVEQVNNVIMFTIQVLDQLIKKDTSNVLPLLFACGIISAAFGIIEAFNHRDGIYLDE